MLSKTICLTKAFNVNSKQQIKQMPNDVIHRLLRHNRAHHLHSSGPPIEMSTKHPMLVLLSQGLRSLVLKSARRIGSQGVRREAKAHASWTRGALLCKSFWKYLLFHKAYFVETSYINALKMWLDINMTTNIANNLKICYLIIVAPQCMYLRYKFSSQGRKRRKR